MGQALTVSTTRDIRNPNSITFPERLKELINLDRVNESEAKREKDSPFSRWTQYNNERTREMMWLALKYPKAHAILLFLVDQMDNYNAVMCSYQVLQEVLEVSKATVQRNIQVLKDNGYIAVLKSGTSNVYAINDTVYWKSWGNNLKYSKFPANIVLALTEQEQGYQISFEDLEHEKIKIVKTKDDDLPNEDK
jgi:DNA-binding transcriptional ArsR family regulator